MDRKYDDEKLVDSNVDDINNLIDEVHKLSDVTNDILNELQVITRKNRRYRESNGRVIKWISIVLVVYAVLLIIKTLLY